MSKLQKAHQESTSLNVVEFSRKIRNAEYSKWESRQRLPTGLARVDIDSRPMGKYDAIFKNYDYIDIETKNLNHPPSGLYNKQKEFLKNPKYRFKILQAILATPI